MLIGAVLLPTRVGNACIGLLILQWMIGQGESVGVLGDWAMEWVIEVTDFSGVRGNDVACTHVSHVVVGSSGMNGFL